MSTVPSPPLPSFARTTLRWALILSVFGLALFALSWFWLSRWQPDRDRWPLQGVAVGSANDPISWPTLAATGAQFAYIDAVTNGSRAHSGFTAEHDRAVAAGLRVGAVHHYALCRLASEQAAAFVTLVPREDQALPTAVMIEDDPDCRQRPTRALLLSELTTFLNQVETHVGKPAIIAPSSAVEAEYRLSEAINRPLWVRRQLRAPVPTATRPWVVWEANSYLHSDGATGAVRRLVLNGAGV